LVLTDKNESTIQLIWPVYAIEDFYPNLQEVLYQFARIDFRVCTAEEN
jgi:hypothetical protein